MTLARLSPLDAAFLTLETRDTPMHVAWAAVFTRPADGELPRFEAVRAHVAGRLDRAPRYRQKLAQVPLGLGDPVWVDDRSFDIANHVRHRPCGHFGELIDDVLSEPLIRDRPLWELWITELEDGRLGVVGKAHHCMVDGLGAVELMALLLDLTPEPERGTSESWRPERNPSGLELLADAVGRAAGRAVTAARAPLGYALDPRRLRSLPGEAWRSGRALLHTVAPASPSRLNRPTSMSRHLACLSRPVADLVTIKRRFGTTINDVLLAASAGAVRGLLLDRGECAARVKAMVPVSVGDADEAWGNRIAFLFLSLPCGEADPLWRLRDVQVAMRERKHHGEPDGADALLGALSYAPRPLRPLASRVLASPHTSNLTISNIPAPQVPLYLLGCQAERAYPVVPLTDRHGVSIGMTIVNGHACFGVYAEAGLAADADRLARGIDEAIDELLVHCRQENGGQVAGEPRSRSISSDLETAPPTQHSPTSRRHQRT